MEMITSVGCLASAQPSHPIHSFRLRPNPTCHSAMYFALPDQYTPGFFRLYDLVSRSALVLPSTQTPAVAPQNHGMLATSSQAKLTTHLTVLDINPS